MRDLYIYIILGNAKEIVRGRLFVCNSAHEHVQKGSSSAAKEASQAHASCNRRPPLWCTTLAIFPRKIQWLLISWGNLTIPMVLELPTGILQERKRRMLICVHKPCMCIYRSYICICIDIHIRLYTYMYDLYLLLYCYQISMNHVCKDNVVSFSLKMSEVLLGWFPTARHELWHLDMLKKRTRQINLLALTAD